MNWNDYVNRGISVFPIIPMTKNPAVKWSVYRTRLPKKKELEEWSSENNNIGVVCGSISGNLVVIDFDNPEFFKVFFPKIANGEMKTWVVETPRPGVHVYFRLDKPVRGRSYRNARIDIKGEGGYVLAPPSIHPNGGRYEFLIGPEDGVEIAQVKSTDFFDLIERRLKELGYKVDYSEEIEAAEKTVGEGDPPYIRKMLEGVEEGMRDEVAIRLASYYLNVRKLTPAAVEAILLDWNTRNKPPMENAEEWVKYKVASALRGGYIYTLKDPLIMAFMEMDETQKQAEEKINQILQQDVFQAILENARKRVKNDDNMLRVILLTAASSFTKNAVNVFVRGPPSIGKTYVTLNALKYFPNVITLMGMSPKTIVHEYSTYSREEDAYIVDLWHKIIVFLEEPPNSVYEILRPLMSHDKEVVEYKWVEQSSSRQKTVKSQIQGWPVFIFLGTNVTLLEDLASRGIHISPRMHEDKWKAATELKGYEYSYPFELYEDPELPILQGVVKRIFDYVKTKNMKVVIPFAKHIAGVLKNTNLSRFPRTARDLTTLFNLVSGSAVLNVFRRPILRIKTNGDFSNYIIASVEDLLNALPYWLEVYPASVTGVNQTQYQLYLTIKENVDVAMKSAKEIYMLWKEKNPDKPISYATIRKYLNALEDIGLLVSEKQGNVTKYAPIDPLIHIDEQLSKLHEVDENAVVEWITETAKHEAYIIFNENECYPLIVADDLIKKLLNAVFQR